MKKLSVAVVGLTLSCMPVGASALAPEDIIRQLYADYMSGDKELKDSAEERIRPHASRALQKAIDEEIHCETKSGEVCAIDSDYIIAGQDWGKLTDFHVDRSSTRDGLSWPANAGHPGDAFVVSRIRRVLCFRNCVRLQLGGPHSRAMTRYFLSL